jgi:hypothetical protein
MVMSKGLFLFCLGASLSCGGDDSSSPPESSTASARPAAPDAGTPQQAPERAAPDASTPQQAPESAGTTPVTDGGLSIGEAPADAADAGRDAADAGSVEACPPPGAIDCSETPSCCGGSACQDDADCSSGCCLPVDAEGGICASSELCETPAIVGCTEVVLRAADGTFLGEATRFLTPDSVCNVAGTYGSAGSPTSIFNPLGTYGNTFGALSAYTPSTLTPPVLFCTTTGASLNPVSKNTTLVDVIDPDVLCAALAANGI